MQQYNSIFHDCTFIRLLRRLNITIDVLYDLVIDSRSIAVFEEFRAG